MWTVRRGGSQAPEILYWGRAGATFNCDNKQGWNRGGGDPFAGEEEQVWFVLRGEGERNIRIPLELKATHQPQKRIVSLIKVLK